MMCEYHSTSMNNAQTDGFAWHSFALSSGQNLRIYNLDMDMVVLLSYPKREKL